MACGWALAGARRRRPKTKTAGGPVAGWLAKTETEDGDRRPEPEDADPGTWDTATKKRLIMSRLFICYHYPKILSILSRSGASFKSASAVGPSTN